MTSEGSQGGIWSCHVVLCGIHGLSRCRSMLRAALRVCARLQRSGLFFHFALRQG